MKEIEGHYSRYSTVIIHDVFLFGGSVPSRNPCQAVERPRENRTSGALHDSYVHGRNTHACSNGGMPSVVSIVKETLAVYLPDFERPVVLERILPENSRPVGVLKFLCHGCDRARGKL